MTFLQVIFASALQWGFISTAAAVVAAAAADRPVSYRKAISVGAVVGVVFGIARIYPVSFVSAAYFLARALLPPELDGVATGFVNVLLTTAGAALTGAAVGALATRSTLAVRRCAIAGGVFGLVVGVVFTGVIFILCSVIIPRMAPGLDGPGAMVIVVTTNLVVGIVTDVVLAVVAVGFIRSRRVAAPPASASISCDATGRGKNG